MIYHVSKFCWLVIFWLISTRFTASRVLLFTLLIHGIEILLKQLNVQLKTRLSGFVHLYNTTASWYNEAATTTAAPLDEHSDDVHLSYSNSALSELSRFPFGTCSLRL